MLNSRITRKAGTFFMLPFRYNDTKIEPPSDVWVKRTMPITNEGNRIHADTDENREVLYAHIMDFLQGQTHEQGTSVTPLRIYSVVSDRREEKSDFGKRFWYPFCARPHNVYIGKSASSSISFRLHCEESCRPTIYMHDDTKVGVLVIYITSECSVDDLIKLNYYLHKIGNIEAKCTTDAFNVNVEKLQSPNVLDSALRKGRLAYHLLSGKPEKDWRNDCLEWDMGQLVNLLLNGTPDNNIRKEMNWFHPFNNIRLHLLTYCIIDDTIENEVGENDCDETLLYLARCCTTSYVLPVKDMISKGAVLHMFDNIHVASFSEGCAIIAVAKKNNWNFTKTYDGQVRMRFFWIYLLAFIQRYALFSISRDLMTVVAKGDQDALWNLLENYQHVKSTCYWSEVSPFTQHTQFYEHCCNGLRLNESCYEIENKSNIIRLVNEHHLRVAVEIQTNAEKDRDNKLASRERRLSILVAMLTVAQVVGVVFSMSEESSIRWLLSIIVGVTLLIVLFITLKLGKQNP